MTDNLRRTPLFEIHRALGARLVPFAGWEMPVQYESALAEHHATRQAAGLFDVSHMGEIFFEGPEAISRLNALVSNDLSTCADGQAQYTALLTEDGGIIDDVVVYRFSAEKLMICANASNSDKDAAWLKSRGEGPGCTVTDKSAEFAQLALQGPRSLDILQPLTPAELGSIRNYCFVENTVAEVPCIISRTGYTGELGFELYFAPEHAEKVWNALLEAGEKHGIKPAGLAARDSLRLECGFRLYGNDLDESTSPLEVGLGWIVKLNKEGGFVGRDALLKQKEEGLKRRQVGFQLTGRGIPREGYPALKNGEEVGKVTSGTLGPTLKQPIGLVFLPVELAEEGSTFEVEIRGKAVPAKVVKTPFYKRES